MNKGNIFGEIASEVLEQGGSVVGQTAKQIIKTPTDLAKTAGGQINPVQPPQENQIDPNKTSVGQNQTNADAKKINEDVVKSLYEKSGNENIDQKTQEHLQKMAEEHPEKTPEELQEIEKLKQELHQTTYYQPLINPQKQEERPAEKIEKEKRQEEEKKMDELKEEEKKEPLAVHQAERKTEIFRGVSG